MTNLLIIITATLILINIVISLFKTSKIDSSSIINSTVNKLDAKIQDQFQRNRSEASNELKQNREELSNTLNINSKNIQETVSINLNEIRKDNNTQIEKMRETVDEKLQKTINSRLKASFESVADKLESVQKGLGEMKNLATDVGGLKKVLSNVKTRGGLGEMQLEMLLENIFAPGQYSKNVITNPSTSNTVEFVINLPSKDLERDHVLLPIDAKFPMDIYDDLLTAYDSAEIEKIQKARKELSKTIKYMAKDISTKYINPPITTDFAYLYLPFEGIYSEVARDAQLVMELRNELNIHVTGPSTLGAILQAFQMGFRTLAIEKKSSEVRYILSKVKKEFSNFSDVMNKAQKHFKTGMVKLDDLMGVRTRAIERSLKSIDFNDKKSDENSIENKNKDN